MGESTGRREPVARLSADRQTVELHHEDAGGLAFRVDPAWALDALADLLEMQEELRDLAERQNGSTALHAAVALLRDPLLHGWLHIDSPYDGVVEVRYVNRAEQVEAYAAANGLPVKRSRQGDYDMTDVTVGPVRLRNQAHRPEATTEAADDLPRDVSGDPYAIPANRIGDSATATDGELADSYEHEANDGEVPA